MANRVIARKSKNKSGPGYTVIATCGFVSALIGYATDPTPYSVWISVLGTAAFGEISKEVATNFEGAYLFNSSDNPISKTRAFIFADDTIYD